MKPKQHEEICDDMFAADANGEGGWTFDETASERRLVCKSGNPWGLL